MARYPKECPVFEIMDGCQKCKGRHSEGAPSIYNSGEIDLWSCVGFCEPFTLDRVKPLNQTAKDMIAAIRAGVKYVTLEEGEVRW